MLALLAFFNILKFLVARQKNLVFEQRYATGPYWKVPCLVSMLLVSKSQISGKSVFPKLYSIFPKQALIKIRQTESGIRIRNWFKRSLSKIIVKEVSQQHSKVNIARSRLCCRTAGPFELIFVYFQNFTRRSVRLISVRSLESNQVLMIATFDP